MRTSEESQVDIDELSSGMWEWKVADNPHGASCLFVTILGGVDSVRSFLSYFLVARGFTFYETVISILLMCVAVFVGISQSTSATASLYGIIIIYLFDFSDMYQTFLKYII